MKHISNFIPFILIIIIAFSCNKAEEKDLVRYLQQEGQSPENYIISKFKDHDYILLGENHRIKHDVDLVARLIPIYMRTASTISVSSSATIKTNTLLILCLNYPISIENWQKK